MRSTRHQRIIRMINFLCEEFRMTQGDVAKLLDRSDATVSGLLRHEPGNSRLYELALERAVQLKCGETMKRAAEVLEQ